jgi:hypothetical protein
MVKSTVSNNPQPEHTVDITKPTQNLPPAQQLKVTQWLGSLPAELSNATDLFVSYMNYIPPSQAATDFGKVDNDISENERADAMGEKSN